MVMEIPTDEFERLGKEIKRLEALVEVRDAEIDRLSRGWDTSIAELDDERTRHVERDALRAENGKLHQQRIRLFDERDKLVAEVERLRAAVAWNEEQRSIQAKEIERLKQRIEIERRSQ